MVDRIKSMIHIFQKTMILPLINYKRTYKIYKKPYEIFQFIENQHLVKSTTLFSQNSFNLVSNLLDNDPLIIEFHLDKAFPSNRPSSRYAASLLRATFTGQDDHTIVNINIRSNWMLVFFYCSLLVGLIFKLTRGEEILPFIIAISIFVLLDISSKIRVKKNFERLIESFPQSSPFGRE